ncbi:MAG: DUF2971 domain-containing protein, partial [Helicobacter sp.]|nr:DUF2971 domain-containing protein [Helicobacter sp.]
MKQHKSFEIPKEQWEKLTFCKFRALVYDQVSEQLIFPIKRCENKLNFDFKEILENSELYMADFEKFNDVDEGRYLFYTNEEYNKELEKAIENIRDKKLKKEICSFSHYDEEAEWVLMWAHYANSHCGVRIDFKINPSYQGKVYQVKYTNKRPTYELGQVPQNLIKIMTTKSKCFSYEREYRAITESQDMSHIHISEPKIPHY